MILLFLMNFMVLAAAWLLVFKILRLGGLVDSLLAVFVFYFSQIVLSELILGRYAKLSLTYLCLLNLAILIAVIFITAKKSFPGNARQKLPFLNQLIENKLVFFLFCITFAFGLVKIIINLVNPPFGWDSLNYHFTFPVEWLKNANLDTPITIADDPSPSYYPINGSLYYLWLMAPLKNVFFADIGQLPFFFAACLSVFAISRRMRLDYKNAFYSAILFFLIPNFFKQLSYAYVDVMVAALFLICLNFLLALHERFDWRNALIFSLSFGLFIGIKTTALVFGTLLAVPFLGVALSKRKIGLLVLFLGLVVLLGGYSYIRNFIQAGNPLYPFNLVIFGKNIFQGVMDNRVYAAHFTLKDYSIAKLLFHEGVGGQGVVFIFPAAILAAGLAISEIRKSRVFMAYFFLLPLFFYFSYRYLIPLANSRYLYALFGLGMAIAFYLLQKVRFPRVALNILVVITAISSAFQLAKRQELTLSLILVLVSLIVFPFILRIFKAMRRAGLARWSIIFCLGIVFLCLFFMEKKYQRNEFSGYVKMQKYSGFWPDATSAWNWLNNNTPGANIAYTGRPVAFPLYGSNFKNNVFYASINCTDPAQLHYFPGSHYSWGYDFDSLHNNLEEENNYRGKKDYSCWLNNLSRRKTNYLFVYSLHQTKEIIFPIEDSWAKANPKNFFPVFTNQTIHVYRVQI
ncbi:MAG: hypothetical protein PHT31_00630 [Candidatus Omnitrophica bacterium]|nr:hypothetical protein [Candidatus Omnitrophota bacterium]MDD5652649.1 hypothetical protein [Candidatus Omnitrophota bacterium]